MNRPVLASALAAVVLAVPASAQSRPGDSAALGPDQGHSTPLPARDHMYRPYRVGERLVYETRVGFLGKVGEAWLTVAGTDTIRGTPTLNLRFGLQASAVFGTLTVDDLLQSWLDPATMRALRFRKDQKELSYETHRVYEFLPAEGRWERSDGTGEEGPLASETPLDDVSFLYFVRSLPLKPGDRYVLDDYFKESGNPVVVEVLRRETVKVPAGQFQTVVVKPTIQTEGLFGEGGEAELYFTDDALHLLVMMKSRMPVLRSLEIRLKSFELGY